MNKCGWFKKGHKINLGRKHSLETIKKLRILSIGNSYASGKRSKEFCKICSERMKSKLQNKNYYLKIIEALKKAHIACKNKKRPQWVKDKIRETILIQRGNPNKEYSNEFIYQLKEKIRRRDNYICQHCSMTEEEHLIVYGKVLFIHHIDYDKKNSQESNLVSLCNQCNSRVNFNRDYWKRYFQENWHKEITKFMAEVQAYAYR